MKCFVCKIASLMKTNIAKLKGKTADLLGGIIFSQKACSRGLIPLSLLRVFVTQQDHADSGGLLSLLFPGIPFNPHLLQLFFQ